MVLDHPPGLAAIHMSHHRRRGNIPDMCPKHSGDKIYAEMFELNVPKKLFRNGWTDGQADRLTKCVRDIVDYKNS